MGALECIVFTRESLDYVISGCCKTRIKCLALHTIVHGIKTPTTCDTKHPFENLFLEQNLTGTTLGKVLKWIKLALRLLGSYFKFIIYLTLK